MTEFEIITLILAIVGLPIAAIKLFIAFLDFLDRRYSDNLGKKKPTH